MPKDWNAVSESGSSSSQDEEYLQNEQQQSPSENKSQKQKSESESQTQTQRQQTQAKKPIEQHKQKPKFISDEELIQKIKSKQLDERRKIKIVNLKSQELLQQIKSHKLISYFKDVKIGDRPTFYIASFRTEDDMIQFIQQKIDKRYRFFLHPYIKSAKDIEREEKYKQRREEEEKERGEKYCGDNREGKVGRDEGRRRGRNRPEYDEEESEEVKEKERRREPKSERQVEVKPERQPQPKSYTKIQQPKQLSSQLIKESKQQKPTSTQQQQQTAKSPLQPKEFNYQIQKNQIRIKSNIYSKNRIADEILYRKIAQKWDRIKIYVKKDGLDKVYELAELIWEKVGYGLKAIPEEGKVQEDIEVVLENKCHVVHPNLEYGLLTENPKKYFDKLTTKNKYLISEKFSLQDYLKEFKANQKQICKKWKQWIIKAEGDNVPVLLKLSWRLRKDLYLNVNIKVGVRNELPFAVLEIQPETDKDKRPKLDTSVVNNYLMN